MFGCNAELKNKPRSTMASSKACTFPCVWGGAGTTAVGCLDTFATTARVVVAVGMTGWSHVVVTVSESINSAASSLRSIASMAGMSFSSISYKAAVWVASAAEVCSVVRGGSRMTDLGGSFFSVCFGFGLDLVLGLGLGFCVCLGARGAVFPKCQPP